MESVLHVNDSRSYVKMAENYKQFDKDPIANTSDVVIKGFKFKLREIALILTICICFLVIIVLSSLLGSKSSDSTIRQNSDKVDYCYTPGCLRSAAYITELINASKARPCDDFHSFACGNFPSKHPLEPYETEETVDSLIIDRNMMTLSRLLNKPLPSESLRNTYEYKLFAFFESCTDHYDKMKQQGTPFLDLILKPSGGWWALDVNKTWNADSYDFNQQLQKTHVEMWTDVFFNIHIKTDLIDWNKNVILITLGGIGISIEWFRVSSVIRMEVMHYKNFMRVVGGLLMRDSHDVDDISQEEIQRRLDIFVTDAYDVESELANMIWTSRKTENPHYIEQRKTLSQLNDIVDNQIDFVALLKHLFWEAQINESWSVVVPDLEYLGKVGRWISQIPAEYRSRKLNNYITWRLAQTYVQDLSWDYIHANRDAHVKMSGGRGVEFFGTWQICVYKLSMHMQDALSALYVRDRAWDANKKAAVKIVNYVKEAMLYLLNYSDNWMSVETRQIAIKKIQGSLYKLGYPEYMIHPEQLDEMYYHLNINVSNYISNLLSFNEYHRFHLTVTLTSRANVRRVKEWVHPTYSYLLQYSQRWRQLILPAGVLQFPIFHPDNPGYMNFGALGSLIGATLYEAVDMTGSHYKLDGAVLGSWWSNQTTVAFQKVAKCMIKAFENITNGPYGTSEMNRKTYAIPKTFWAPQALRDASGVKLAFKAYQMASGDKLMPGHLYTTNQLFFVSFAQAFCYSRGPLRSQNMAESERWVDEKARVNGALMQVEEFQKAFQCDTSSNMVTSERCTLL